MVENQFENSKIEHKCSAGVAGRTFICRYCKNACKKYGFTKGGKQRFQCMSCKRISLAYYKAPSFSADLNKRIILLLKEGCSIRSISRILKIAASTVVRRIMKVGSTIGPPAIAPGQAFELDELCTFSGSKKTQVWIAYAINSITRQAVAVSIGNRSCQMLSQVTEPLLAASALKITTDKLLQYKNLIPAGIHSTKKYGINHIERKNLTLRTHLKRLNRKTICFSRSIAMLQAYLTIYFFG